MYSFKTNIEDWILKVYVWDIKKSIVCDIQRFNFKEVSDINVFISFITAIEEKYDLYLYIDQNKDLKEVYNSIELLRIEQLNN